MGERRDGIDDRSLIEAQFRRLDATTLAAFVEDFWAARGFDVERDGRIITARSANGTEVVYVAGAVEDGDDEPEWLDVDDEPELGQDDGPGPDVDVVVDVEGESYEGKKVLDDGDLTERLWYAVDRPVGRELYEEYLAAVPD